MPQTIDSIDRFFLTLFNGSHSMFLDEFALLFTNTVAWVPLFIALIILVVKNNEKTSQVMLLIGAVALGFLLSDGLADGIVKPLVGRLRPVNDPSMAYFVNVVNGYHPSGYSFFSAHAANTLRPGHAPDADYPQHHVFDIHVPVGCGQLLDTPLPRSTLHVGYRRRYSLGLLRRSHSLRRLPTIILQGQSSAPLHLQSVHAFGI